ncbi:hypothetical protein NLX71_22310 [Paenibacillus sp. MZ04-78.2]|uniref:hypothetical protein n=1 Tax=Paenibacillus sp. MZ04-78.2 TaxID=2962034 RepID=UPI0020B76572|nr:hypothetical protein [Paenibacillus sp. MZ04-78.2]MCP3776001.1 hypothetical protein [Paenibacillus sp. MZ04-78.2]
MKKKLASTVVAIALVCSFSTSVFAHDTAASSKETSSIQAQTGANKSPNIIIGAGVKGNISQSYLEQLKKDFPDAKQITIQRMDSNNSRLNPHEITPYFGFDLWTKDKLDHFTLIQNDSKRDPYILYASAAKGQTIKTTESMERTTQTTFTTEVSGEIKKLLNVKGTGSYQGTVKSTVTNETTLVGPPESSKSNSRFFYMQASYTLYGWGVKTYGVPSGNEVSAKLGGIYVPVWLYFSVDN